MGCAESFFTRSCLRPSVADPAGKPVLLDLAGAQGEHDRRRLGWSRRERHAVQSQEDHHRRERPALVAVEEGVVVGDAEGVRSREARKIGFAIMPAVLRPHDRRLEQSLVADPVWATEQRKLFGMDVHDGIEIEPARLVGPRHSARALKVSWYSFISSRAIFMTSSCFGS